MAPVTKERAAEILPEVLLELERILISGVGSGAALRRAIWLTMREPDKDVRTALIRGALTFLREKRESPNGPE